MPPAVDTFQESGVDQAAEHFLDEERIALGPFDHELSHVGRKLAAQQRVDK